MNKTLKFDIVTRLKPYRWYFVGGVLLCAVVIAIFSSFQKKENQTDLARQELILLANNVRNAYRTKPDAWGLNSQQAVKNQIVPANMIKNNLIFNALGKEVLIGADALGQTVMPGSRNFALTFKNLNYDECINFATFALNEECLLGLSQLTVSNRETHLFSWESNGNLPLSEEQAGKICQDKNDITWDMFL